MRIRIIPTTIIVASLFMAVKITDVVNGSEELSQALFISDVVAEQTEQKNETKAEEEKIAEPGKEKEAGGDKGKKNPHVTDTVGDITDRPFSKVELELLQNLARRRDELSRWESNIQVKEAALDATERRISDKIIQIEAMKKEVSSLLEEYNKQEDMKIKSLVRIYENMKAKDAARIFDELDMPILFLVIDKMSEKKAAPILANMTPKKAKMITTQLAAERQIKNNKFNTLTSDKN